MVLKAIMNYTNVRMKFFKLARYFVTAFVHFSQINKLVWIIILTNKPPQNMLNDSPSGERGFYFCYCTSLQPNVSASPWRVQR